MSMATHAHFNEYGINLNQYADLRSTQNIEEIYDILKKHHRQFGGDWILGRSGTQMTGKFWNFPIKLNWMNYFLTHRCILFVWTGMPAGAIQRRLNRQI